ncbi:hypothetical protein HOP50_05g35880 [Chloropicon primus]|nr:hypothetical protein HOP50_05g35880 [Chloropicon primus]
MEEGWSSESSSPEELARVRARMDKRQSKENWEVPGEPGASQVAWGAAESSPKDMLSLSSLKQLRQELEEAKTERRNLLKAAQNALKNPLKVVQVPHRLDSASARKSDVTNQRRKLLKEVVDALSVSLTRGADRGAQGRGGGQKEDADKGNSLFTYDIEIQAVVSFVQDKFDEIMSAAVEDLKGKARAHKLKALAKAEENATKRLRNLERASKQEQDGLSQEVYKSKRQIDSLKKKLNNAQLECSRKDRELRTAMEGTSEREKKIQDKLGRAVDRAQRAEKRAADTTDLMATQVEEIQKQTRAMISEHEGRSELIALQVEQQRSRAESIARDYSALCKDAREGQEDLKREIEGLEGVLSPCEDLLQEREAYLRAAKEEVEGLREETLATVRGFVKDMSEACTASETVRNSWTKHWAQMSTSGNWVSKEAHERRLLELQAEREKQDKKMVELQSELSGFQKVVERAQTDKAIADTKVRKMAETTAELRQKVQEEEQKSKSLEAQLDARKEELATMQASLFEKKRESESQSRQLEELTAACKSAEQLVHTRRKEAWKEASSSLSDLDGRLSLLVGREPVKLSSKSWLEALSAIEERKDQAEAEGASEETGGMEEKGNFSAALKTLESKFAHALRSVCLSVKKEQKELSKQAAVASPTKVKMKPRPRAIIRSGVQSLARADEKKLSSPRKGVRSAASPRKARSKVLTDVQTALAAIKKARELSGFDAKVTTRSERPSTSTSSYRKEGTGIRSLAKPRGSPIF